MALFNDALPVSLSTCEKQEGAFRMLFHSQNDWPHLELVLAQILQQAVIFSS